MDQQDLLDKVNKLTEKLKETEKKRIDLKVDFKATLVELEALNGLLEEKEKDRDQLVKLVSQLRCILFLVKPARYFTFSFTRQAFHALSFSEQIKLLILFSSDVKWNTSKRRRAAPAQVSPCVTASSTQRMSMLSYKENWKIWLMNLGLLMITGTFNFHFSRENLLKRSKTFPIIR